MFKTNNEIISIEAKATDPIPTGVVFWSHDKGTAKMIFRLKKDNVNQTLSEGTIIPILLEFLSATAENGRGRHIYHAVIEDALNGIVSIILEDNILGYQGKVDGSIYIELPDKRSLDTAGRFSFEIKRSPIDEEVPELEDYYWQGFNEIMESYHQTIAGIKLEAKELLDSLKQDVSSAQEKVSQLEQSISTANTNFNARIDEISKKIDENDVYTKAESSANVVNQVIGKDDSVLPLTLDMKNKVAGSTVENANRVLLAARKELPKEITGGEIRTSEYLQLAALDSSMYPPMSSVAENMIMLTTQFNLYDYCVRYLGEKFFEQQGATDLSSKIELVKVITDSFSGIVWGYGSGSSGYKLSLAVRNVIDGSWLNTVEHDFSSTTKLECRIEDVSKFVDSNGMVTFITYADASDGTKPSSMKIDYVLLDVNLNISANDHIKKMIAHYCGDLGNKNIKFKKVGEV